MTAADAADATEAGLLLDIVEYPHDDTPRLIYADWLTDHGQPERAEFIRVQVELAPPEARHSGFHLDDGSENSCRVCTLRRRDHELLRLHGRGWHPSGLGHDEVLWHSGSTDSYKIGEHSERVLSCWWRRGFVAEARCSCADWLAHGPALVRQQPITEVRLVDKEPHRALLHDRIYWYTTSDQLTAHIGELWKWLPGVVAAGGVSEGYATPEAAHADLSHACVAWARANVPCRDCEGSGYDRTDLRLNRDCPACGGTGKKPLPPL